MSELSGLAEARLTARLTHPNVVAVLDTGEEDGRPYVVMERLSGRTLRDVALEEGVDADLYDRVIDLHRIAQGSAADSDARGVNGAAPARPRRRRASGARRT